MKYVGVCHICGARIILEAIVTESDRPAENNFHADYTCHDVGPVFDPQNQTEHVDTISAEPVRSSEDHTHSDYSCHDTGLIYTPPYSGERSPDVLSKIEVRCPICKNMTEIANTSI